MTEIDMTWAAELATPLGVKLPKELRDKQVYEFLRQYQRRFNCFPSVREVEILNIDYSTAAKAIQRLADRGYVVRGRGGRNLTITDKLME